MARPRNVSDEQILEEARACFLEHGASVPTTVIAERLGVSHGVLFQRFGTKEQLLWAALAPPSEAPWFSLVRAGPDERDVRAQLRELAGEISAYLDRIVPCITILRSAGLGIEWMKVPPEDKPPVRARREIEGWFSRAIARGLLRPHKPEHAADLFLGALQFRPFHQHLLRETLDRAEVEPYLDFTVDMICRTLGPSGEPF